MRWHVDCGEYSQNEKYCPELAEYEMKRIDKLIFYEIGISLRQ